MVLTTSDSVSIRNTFISLLNSHLDAEAAAEEALATAPALSDKCSEEARKCKPEVEN